MWNAASDLPGFTKEIDVTYIAAMLTVAGYSINNAVVVFDRIRENMKERKTDDAGGATKVGERQSLPHVLQVVVYPRYCTGGRAVCLFNLGAEPGAGSCPADEVCS